MMLAKALASASASAAKVYVEDVFSTWLYTGNGSTQTITNGIDLSGKGGLTWIKSRSSGVEYHNLFDTARGAEYVLFSNTTDASGSSPTRLSSFNSTGFTVGSNAATNASSATFASWTFRKAAKFFDVVTYVGDGTAGHVIPHNLGSTPGCVIIKRTDTTGDWYVWHRSLSATYGLKLNSTAAQDVYDIPTAVSASNFTLDFTGGGNANGGTYVAYLFAHDAGGFGDSGNDSVVKCGSFTTPASGSIEVDLGWEPQWLLVKASSNTGGWFLFDNMRRWAVGSNDQVLQAHLSDAEFSGGYGNPIATGFTTAGLNSSQTYIYIAIRRGPMKTPTDATKVFTAVTATPSTGTARNISFVSDMYTASYRNAGATGYLQSRLTGFSNSSSEQTPALLTPYTQAETTAYSPGFYDIWNSTYKDGPWANQSAVWYHFGRAPGFFDVVALTGTNSATAYSHNLGVTPEMIIVKKRSGTSDWLVYQTGYPTPTTNQGALNLSGGSYANSNFPTAPTSTQFTLHVFDTGTYISYLFASCPGVSKVGSYTGTGTTLDVNCGFTNGARFVLIKRTDSTGDWFFWDTARGIVSGNDSYLRFNVDAAEVTGNDYIDPLSSGFQISSTAPAAINANGGSFIFLAIA